MLSFVRRPQPRAALAIILSIAVFTSACQSVELSEETSPGTVGSVNVHIHNGLFDEVPQPGYTVSLHRGAISSEPRYFAVSQAGQSVWLRGVPPGTYFLDVTYGELNRGEQVYLKEVSVKADTITCLRIESRAHDDVNMTGTGSSNLGEVTVKAFQGLGLALAVVVGVGLVVGLATAPIWVPFAAGKKKD